MPSWNAAGATDARRRLAVAVLALAGLGLVWLALAAAPLKAAPLPQAGGPGDQGAQLFQTKCTSCHTVGQGKLVGPDLKDVGQRRNAQWLKDFISDPAKLFAANDPTAAQLLAENNNIRMPSLGLAPAQVDALIAYLNSGRPAAAAGATAGAAAAGSAAAGARLFTGGLALQGGGPACIGCHTTSGSGSLGGGALGPDLTHVAQRYGEAGLAAALKTIAFPTMAGPFANRPLAAQEQADLVAYFVQLDRQQPPVAVITPGALTANAWLVLGIGLAGMAVLFGVLAFFWPRQRQSVSARLRGQGSGRRA